MKKSSRYLLIGFGFVVFFVIAPLLILYVSGTKLHLDSRDASSTGILDVKSEPSGAQVTVNDDEKGTTPTTVRFLTQGEYLVTISKEGYYDWSKRLPIEAGQVRFAQEGVDVVQLIKKSTETIISPNNVSSFLLAGDTIWFAQNNNLVYAPLNEPTNQTTLNNVFTAPGNLWLLRDKNHILIPNGKQSILINNSSKIISALPFEVTRDWQIQTPSDDIVIYGDGDTLTSYNLNTKVSIEVKSGVRAFTMINNTAYFARTDGVISSAVWNGTNFADEQAISNNVQLDKSDVSLIITDRKELFLNNAGSGFYRVGPVLDQIVSRVDKALLDPITNEMTLQIAGELWFYNFLTNKPQLLTRSTEQVSSFFIRSSIGYGFVGSTSGLEIVEIDTRDKQNRYKIISNKPVYQIAITANQKTVLALQDGALVMLELRD